MSEENLEIVEHSEDASPAGHAWKLLIVDDDDEIHEVTRMALKNFEFRNRALQFLSAHSAAEGREVLAHEEDIAVILLDVVMESDHAGLELIDYIRGELKNRGVRIIMRTGQPGQAPPREVVRKYDISDYRDKSELTVQKLDTLLCTSLAMYEEIRELQRSNRDLEHFAYVVSHDLQEPLRAVTGFARLLGQDAAEKLTEKEKEYLEYIVQGAHRLRDMIRSLLELSRLSTRAGGYEPVQLEEVIEEAMRDLHEVVTDSAARVEYESLPQVTMDKTQAVILFRNLLSNSIRYRNPDEKPVIHISATESGSGWKIEYADNGIGFDQSDAERIFSIFTQLHRSDEYGGTGIGLALCDKIVRRHGGTISATSSLGEGAKFHIFLPDTPPA